MKLRLFDKSWLMSNQLSGQAEIAYIGLWDCSHIRLNMKDNIVPYIPFKHNPKTYCCRADWQQQGIYVMLKIITDLFLNAS